jgi:beta-lactam-binding protein with PASTA domain
MSQSLPLRGLPNVLDDTRSQATAAIQAAGLTVGQVVNETDNTCNHLNTVMDQSPQGGEQAALGSAVSLHIGQQPTNMVCP